MSMPGRNRQTGFSIIAALFLIVVLGAMALFLASITATTHQVSALAYRESQALLAARAGVERAIFQEVSGGQNGACDSAGTLPALAAYPGFTIAVTCSVSVHTEQGNSQDVYVLTITARAGGAPPQPGYVRRVLQATVVVQ